MGKIYIAGLAVETLIGVYDWERVRNTELLIDVTLETDLEKAMLSDNVADTVDYAKVAECVAEVGKNSQFELLEAFGGAVMEAIFEQFAVTAITLKIVKPNILPNAKTVAVELTRERV
ncbi:bifunctional dihydroneopterin aldolase/7,8-dihydroneopterin epimerase [Alteromonas sp. D210916BOD_24]|uniref:dihydroneopterin aldolase n=1 Tax=Alteromonas sp. D210916BOD_24 TaxID=3157618 RepID=UPI00399CD563